MHALEETFRESMPQDKMGFSYLGMSYQQQKAAQGVPPAAIFALSLLFVFLILAALYESWSLPFSVLLSLPIAVIGAFLGLLARSMENNAYAQNRSHHAHRPRGEKRDSHRRVLPRGIGQGQAADGRRAGRRAPASAARS